MADFARDQAATGVSLLSPCSLSCSFFCGQKVKTNDVLALGDCQVPVTHPHLTEKQTFGGVDTDGAFSK